MDTASNLGCFSEAEASNVVRVVIEGGGGSLGRVIYVIESPFSNRDVERYGMVYLRSSGFEVEAWNVAPIYLPATENQWIDAPDDFLVRRFTSEDEIRTNCRALTSQDNVILMSGVYLGQRRSQRTLIQEISKSPAILGMLSGDLPLAFETNFVVKSIFSDLSLARPRSWFDTCRRLFIRFLRRNSYKGSPSLLGRIERAVFGLRPLDFIWASASVRNVCPHVIGPQTLIRYIHTQDFEAIRNKSFLSFVQSNIAVYIDDMAFSHPDFESSYGVVLADLDLPLLNSGSYEAVCRALDQFEADTGLQIEIAAHPRAEPGSLDHFFNGRNVRHGMSVDLLSKCHVMIQPSSSTITGLAVALERPIIILKSTSFELLCQVAGQALSKELKVPLVDIDAEDLKFEIPEIDKQAYALYKKRYVKRANSIDLPFWEVVARDLGAEPVN